MKRKTKKKKLFGIKKKFSTLNSSDFSPFCPFSPAGPTEPGIPSVPGNPGSPLSPVRNKEMIQNSQVNKYLNAGSWHITKGEQRLFEIKIKSFQLSENFSK